MLTRKFEDNASVEDLAFDGSHCRENRLLLRLRRSLADGLQRLGSFLMCNRSASACMLGRVPSL